VTNASIADGICLCSASMDVLDPRKTHSTLVIQLHCRFYPDGGRRACGSDIDRYVKTGFGARLRTGMLCTWDAYALATQPRMEERRRGTKPFLWVQESEQRKGLVRGGGIPAELMSSIRSAPMIAACRSGFVFRCLPT
jgi:hypothetical protein